MRSAKSEFKFLERGLKETLVLLPGWGTDYRIFKALDLNYNYLLATRVSPFNFLTALREQLEKERISRVSVFGFSLGGFLAAEFAAKYPAKISELILTGVRRCYEPKILAESKRELCKNRKAWLYKFYLNCFSRLDTESLSWFKKHLLKEYLENLDQKELIDGLDYLGSHWLQPETLTRIGKIRIFHGSEDRIASLKEALEIKSELPQAKFISLPGLGHFAFLNPLFRQNFYG